MDSNRLFHNSLLEEKKKTTEFTFLIQYAKSKKKKKGEDFIHKWDPFIEYNAFFERSWIDGFPSIHKSV